MKIKREKISEKVIVKRLKKGDPAAFEWLFNAYKQQLYQFAVKFLKSKELTLDLIHDLFVKIWENRRRLDPEASFGAYLHTICKNRIYNQLKLAARRKELLEEIIQNLPASHNGTENDYWTTEYQKMANDAISKLPPRRKQVFVLCRLRGKSYEEAAKELGISRNAVKEHMVKATKYLKECFVGYIEIANY